MPSKNDILRYAEMRDDYIERCVKLPDVSRYTIALLVCAYGFEIPIHQLTAHDRKPADLVELRQKMMAFSRVVSLATPHVNTWKGIAETFQRRHSTVIYATHKYGAQIATALEVSK